MQASQSLIAFDAIELISGGIRASVAQGYHHGVHISGVSITLNGRNSS